MSGRFITFEGSEGCGKSTQIAQTAEWLRQMGLRVMTTFEPGDGDLCSDIRRLLLSGEHVPVPEAELLLFLADRAQHVATSIRPALERGEWVLCDRYSDSTFAYQLAGRDLDDGRLTSMLSFAEMGCHPDLTLWLDMPVSDALARMRGRVQLGEDATRLDEEALAFHERVRTGFAEACKAEPGRICRIDAAATAIEVQAAIRQVIGRHFGLPA